MLSFYNNGIMQCVGLVLTRSICVMIHIYTYCSFIQKNNFFLFYVCDLPVCLSMYQLYAYCLQRPEECIGFPGNELHVVVSSHVGRAQESNPGPTKEQQLFLTFRPYLQLTAIIFMVEQYSIICVCILMSITRLENICLALHFVCTHCL